jgi:hypothetical protein
MQQTIYVHGSTALESDAAGGEILNVGSGESACDHPAIAPIIAGTRKDHCAALEAFPVSTPDLDRSRISSTLHQRS